MEICVGHPGRHTIRRWLYSSTSACSNHSPCLSVCFGRCVHVLGRAPDQVSVQVERQSGSGNFPSFQHYTVTSLAPSCDLGQFTLLPYPYRSDILPSLRLRIACCALPMLHLHPHLLPCDDDERRRGAVRARTRPRPPFARIGIHT